MNYNNVELVYKFYVFKLTNLSFHFQTTFVLRRTNNPPLAKKNQRPKKLRGRHFNFKMIVDTNIVRQPDLQVVLTEFVEGIGQKGEVVNARPNFAYQKLLLPGLAAYATPENIEKFKAKVEEKTEKMHSSQFSQRVSYYIRFKIMTLYNCYDIFKTVNMLQHRVFAIVMNKDHPWVIEPWHIRASLRKCGCFITSDSSIELPEEKITGPDLTKQNKEFYVTVTVNNTEKAKVRCRIHHWSTVPADRLPYATNHWLEEAEPLFGFEKPPTQV